MDMRRLAWDGIAFDVPDNWELARYRYPGGGRIRLEIEDEISRRLEIEWMTPGTVKRSRRFMEQATYTMEKMIARADRRTDIGALPTGWRATHCEFRETLPLHRTKGGLGVVRHHLVTAVYAPADRALRCALRLHFMPGDPEDPKALAHRLIQSFEVSESSRTPWRVFDLDFELDRAFQLEATSFEIGAKLMIFRRRSRKLYLWTLSCADRILTEDTQAAEWVTGFLNARRKVPGIMFMPAPGARDTVSWRRRGLLTFVHRDETARWCFHYAIGFRHDQERNHIVIWVFNYRHPADLEWLRPYPEMQAG